MQRIATKKLRAQFYAEKAVVREQIDESGRFHLWIKMPKRRFDELGLDV